MRKLEKIFWGLFIVGLIFKINHWPFTAVLVVFSLTLVSCLYFVFGFAFFNGLRLRDIFKKERYSGISPLSLIYGFIFGWSLSILTIGFLFKFMLWPGANTMLLSGLITLGVSVIIYLVLNKINLLFIPTKSFLRVLLIGIITFSFYLIKTDTIIDFYYKNKPEYAETLKAVIKEPNNIELRKKLHKLREEQIKKEIELMEK